MRSELLKRVADYDARTLDSLVEKKNEYDEKLVTLQEEEAAYDEQSEELENQRAELAELYQSSQESKELLKQQKEDLAQQQETNANEIYSYEGTLSDLLKGTYGSSDDETQRMQTELDANSKLLELRTALSERVAAGETISDEECTYSFKWPVPNHYNVSSGVGERWGTYHKGLDITGESGTAIYAAEYGTVVRMNNSCTHNYGKSSSCGCGGGYGNYVIIDHGNGFLTLYGHLTQATVEVGDTVKRGDQIGLMGTTGYSTGTHLHFELRYNGYITNPASFLTLE
jgi:murein DD-endopeptidase MepM/ murein hydrolase activator NlpD